MERAASECFHWLKNKFGLKKKYVIFCGPGNNGGDGLAIARMLKNVAGMQLSVFLIGKKNGSEDFKINLDRFEKIAKVNYISDRFPDLNNCVVIDAIFGTGLNKPVGDPYLSVIKEINHQKALVVSIDIPSGMYADKTSGDSNPVRADYTLTFQQQKLAFLIPENAPYTGKVVVLPIGLSETFKENEKTSLYLTDEKMLSDIYKPRNQFSNKGNYGYACMIAGSLGMIGAAVLSAHGCLRSGVGKMTCYVCKAGYQIVQIMTPEALCKVFGEDHIKNIKDLEPFDALGIGPGIGQFDSHVEMLEYIFTNFKKPIVIDADALNVMSEHKHLYQLIPKNSIITPHPKEFERLFGKSDNDFAQRELALKKAEELNIFIVLKGRYTFIASPDGKGVYNSTGNAGMATAGSGDVLTGILTGLLAQHYSSYEACVLGTYLHGLAGDLAASELSQEALISGDLYQYLGKAFLQISDQHSF